MEQRRVGSGCRLASQVGRVQGSGRFWGLAIGPREGVLLGANLGRTIVSNGDFTAHMCATVPQPSELQFGVVLAVCRGTAVLDGGQRSPTGRGCFGGFCSTFSQWEMPLDRRR